MYVTRLRHVSPEPPGWVDAAVGCLTAGVSEAWYVVMVALSLFEYLVNNDGAGLCTQPERSIDLRESEAPCG